MVLSAIFVLAQAPPDIDANIYGYVNYSNNSRVGAGFNVTAWIGGVQKGTIGQTIGSGSYQVTLNTSEYLVGDNVTLIVNQSGHYGTVLKTNVQKGSNYPDNIVLTDYQAPSAVIGLTATVINTGNQLNLSWTANTDDTQGYKLYKDGTLIATITPKSNNSYLDSGLTNGQTYTYKISAYDSTPNYASNTTTTRVPQDSVAPGQVSTPSVLASNQTVFLSWSAVTANASDLLGYHVFGNSSDSWTLLNTTSSSILNITYTGLDNNQPYYYKVRAFDDDGNNGNFSNVVSGTPSERPTITAITSSGSIVMSSVFINFSIASGTAMDTVWYRVYNLSVIQQSDNQTNSTSVGTSWSYSISPSSWDENEVYTITVFANDTNGQYIQENFTYSVDDTVPSVPVLSVNISENDNIVKSTTNIIIDALVTDVNQAGLIVTVGVNGTEVSMLNDSSVTNYQATATPAELGCSEGSCTIKFKAVDIAGNINDSTEYTFTVDDTAPAVFGANTDDSDNKVKSSDSINITVNVTDSVGIVSVVVNGTSMTNIAGNIWSTVNTTADFGCTSDGACVLTFVATDNATNTNSSTTLTITVDDTAPAVFSANTSDSDNIVNSTNSITISVNATDTNNVLSVLVNGTSMSQSGSVWSTTNATSDFGCISDGACVLTFVATDSVTNVNSTTTLTITVDDTKPVINSVALSSNYVQNNTNATVTVNATDTNILIVSAEGVNLTRSGDIWTGTISLTTSPLNIVVTDKAGNTATDNSVTFIIDDTAPVVSSVVLDDYYIKSTQSVSYIVNITNEDNTTIASVVVEGNSLLWNGSFWTGLGTTTADGYVNITVTDNAGNVGTNNSYTYTVDNVLPVITVNYPTNNLTITNADGNVTFNMTIVEVNLSMANISVDSGSWTAGTTSSGTVTLTIANIQAGLHTAVFTAIDEASNSAISVSKTFRVNRPVNLSQVANTIRTSVGSSLMTGFRVKENTTDLTSNTTLVNKTLNIEMDLNVSGVTIGVKIPEFSGLDANWNQLFTIESNESSSKGTIATQRAGTTIQKLVLFQSASNFLAENAYRRGAVITFSEALSSRDVLFIADDDGNTVYGLSLCTGGAPSGAITTTNMCYLNTTTNVTVYIPHFSGAALANDTTAPVVNITSPINDSVADNSIMTLTFDVYEANPRSTNFCWYQLNSSIYGTPDLIDFTRIGSSTKYTYTVNISDVRDDVYTLIVNCTDQNNRTGTQSYTVNVSDSVAPVILSTGPTGEQSTSSSTKTVTLSTTTNEKAECRYYANNRVFSSMTSVFDGNGTTSHSATVSYSADSSSETFYVRCKDLSGNENNVSSTITFSVNVGSGTTGGGVVIATTPVYAKVWNEIPAGSTEKISISVANLPVNSLSFETLNDISGAKIDIKALSAAPATAGAIKNKAYKYLSLTKTNINDADITGFTIGFKVEKSWLSENSVGKINIVLMRFADSSWNELETSIESEDSDYIYFKAISPGMSYFAIGERDVVVHETEATPEEEIEPTTEIQPEDDIQPAHEDDEETEAGKDESTIKEPPVAMILWIVVIIVAVIIVVFVFLEEKKKKGCSICNFFKPKAKKEAKNDDASVDKESEKANKANQQYEKLESFIKTHFERGLTEKDIKGTLLKTGWTEEQMAPYLKKYRK